MRAQRASNKAHQRDPVDAGLGLNARKRMREGVRGDSGRARPVHLGLCDRECPSIDLRPIGKPQGQLLSSLACGHRRMRLRKTMSSSDAPETGRAAQGRSREVGAQHATIGDEAVQRGLRHCSVVVSEVLQDVIERAGLAEIDDDGLRE